jgi:hypothetical protein
VLVRDMGDTNCSTDTYQLLATCVIKMKQMSVGERIRQYALSCGMRYNTQDPKQVNDAECWTVNALSCGMHYATQDPQM